MPLTRPTITEIKERIEKGIESRLFDKVALLRVALLRILARVFAGAIHGNYGYIVWLSDQLFVITAESQYLNRHGRMWGVIRRPGSFATGEATFNGTNGTLIPADTRVQTDQGVEFAVVDGGTVSGGSVDLEIQAVEPGVDGNLEVTVVLQMVSPIAGVEDEVPLKTATENGVDTESDDDFRDRILQRIQQVPAGGSADDYVRWATSVTGVKRAWCYPLDDGPGTVVTVISADHPTDPTPSASLLTEVEEYIESVRPVTAQQRVASIQDLNQDPGYAAVEVSILLTPNTAEIQDRINQNLEAIYEPHRPGTDIKISQIRAAISNAGVSDFEITGIEVDSNPVADVNADVPLFGYVYPKAWTNSFGDI